VISFGSTEKEKPIKNRRKTKEKGNNLENISSMQ